MKAKVKKLVCLGCPKGSDPELLHPKLQIPICGSCNASIKDADQSIVNENMVSCIWCGFGDGCELFMCDTCVHAFCTDCVSRNFGDEEAEQVRSADYWSCYICEPTAKFKALQVRTNVTYFNIDKAYADVQPPKGQDFECLNMVIADKLTTFEKSFASLFCNGLVNSSIQDLNIVADYLKAGDVLSTMFRISRTLRKFFKSKIFLIPGLFRTSYGVEHQCKLHYHQLVGLNYMTLIENRTASFGDLRGGIFGDEPGLGKTVTCLALIASSAGTNPVVPSIFWDNELIASQWASMRGQHSSILLPVVNSLGRHSALTSYQGAVFKDIARNLETYCDTIDGFQAKVREVISSVAGCNLDIKDKLLDKFRQGMSAVKEGLDVKKRKEVNSPVTARARYERSLLASHGTLIIVPQTLLEHWYEQIMRHLNLMFFTRNTASANDESGGRGVVYIDGLGDIMDIVPPLNKLNKNRSSVGEKPKEFLSHFLIVVTTYERCETEFRRSKEHADKVMASSTLSLLQIRWLRLLVDEGHEIGLVKTGLKDAASSVVAGTLNTFEASDASLNTIGQFISQIAAERRWIMSGTPTTGSNSELGLSQLFRLLTFLRHPLLLQYDAQGEDVTGSGRRSGKKAKTVTDSVLDILKLCNGAELKTELETSLTTSSSNTSSTNTNDDFAYWTAPLPAASLVVASPTAKRSSSATPTTPAKAVRYSSAADYWNRAVVKPCLAQKEDAWAELTALLRTLMVRHTKNDLALFAPINSTVNLEPMRLASDQPFERRILGVDRAKAKHIADTMRCAIKEWREVMRSGDKGAMVGGIVTKNSVSVVSGSGSSAVAGTLTGSATVANFQDKTASYSSAQKLQFKRRRPKAIVFSQHDTDLQGVGHFLYKDLGDSYICEHFGDYQSAELSRFRHSKRKFKQCPLCGFCNSVADDRNCTQVLFMVEYLDVEAPPEGVVFSPERGGHGATGPGGHFTGDCLCSPKGCGAKCGKFRNAFRSDQNLLGPDYALIRNEDVHGWELGAPYFVANQIVYVKSRPAVDELCAPDTPWLWRGGVMGGRAAIRYWRKCGGKDTTNSWHGDGVLRKIPWQVESEPACIMLLKEDGSTGLDLSFATHIFLLERIKDPALRSQIVSRAHRMGATGPVEVQLIQVQSVEEEDNSDDEA